MKTLITLVATSCISIASLAQTGERALSFTIDINAPVDTVWSRWSTVAGLKKFFAPAANIELKTFGHLDILFAPGQPAGQRGAENNMILAVQEKQMLSFTWDAPPTFPEVRRQRTSVIVRFVAIGVTRTQVNFTQIGFGSGPEWDAVYNYFGPAWASFVLPNLKYSCEGGTIDFSNFPANVPKGLAPAKKL
jgi:uncharacterized protein YndB with AHSA1/START domain